MRQQSSASASALLVDAPPRVFAARDSHRLVWNQIRNVRGAGADGGVFLDGAQSMRTPGVDGLVNTADDGPAVEQTQMPGPDNILGTADDRQLALYGFTREIAIRVACQARDCGVNNMYVAAKVRIRRATTKIRTGSRSSIWGSRMMS